MQSKIFPTQWTFNPIFKPFFNTLAMKYMFTKQHGNNLFLAIILNTNRTLLKLKLRLIIKMIIMFKIL
jgi:hypothetical protein